jgi:hypothetical protein
MLCDGKNAFVEHLQWCGQVKFLLLCHLMVCRLIQGNSDSAGGCIFYCVEMSGEQNLCLKSAIVWWPMHMCMHACVFLTEKKYKFIPKSP